MPASKNSCPTVLSDCALNAEMKKPEHTFTISIEPGGNSIIGIPPGHTLSIALASGKQYSAPIEWIHTAMSRKHQRENPSGKHPRRRRLLASSEAMKGWKK